MSGTEQLLLEITYLRGGDKDVSRTMPLQEIDAAFEMALHLDADCFRVKKIVPGEGTSVTQRIYLAHSEQSICAVADAIQNLEYNIRQGRAATAPAQIRALKHSKAEFCFANGYSYTALGADDLVFDKTGAKLWPRSAPKFKITILRP